MCRCNSAFGSDRNNSLVRSTGTVAIISHPGESCHPFDLFYAAATFHR